MKRYLKCSHLFEHKDTTEEKTFPVLLAKRHLSVLKMWQSTLTQNGGVDTMFLNQDFNSKYDSPPFRYIGIIVKHTSSS